MKKKQTRNTSLLQNAVIKPKYMYITELADACSWIKILLELHVHYPVIKRYLYFSPFELQNIIHVDFKWFFYTDKKHSFVYCNLSFQTFCIIGLLVSTELPGTAIPEFKIKRRGYKQNK